MALPFDAPQPGTPADPNAVNDEVLQSLTGTLAQPGPPPGLEATPSPRLSLVELAKQVRDSGDEDKRRKADLLRWMSENHTLSAAESETVGKLSAATGVDPNAIVAQGIENFRKQHAYNIDWYDVANRHPALAELLGDPAHGPSAITETQKLGEVSKMLGQWEVIKIPPGPGLFGPVETPSWGFRLAKNKEGMILQSLVRSWSQLIAHIREGAAVTGLDTLGLFTPAKIAEIVQGEGDFATNLNDAWKRTQRENREEVVRLQEEVAGLEDITGDMRGYSPAGKFFVNTMVNHVIPALSMVALLGGLGAGVGLAARFVGVGSAATAKALYGTMFVANTLISSGAIKERLDTYKDPDTGKTFDEDQKRLISLLGGAATGYVWAPGVTNIVRRELPGIMPEVVKRTSEEILAKATGLQIIRDSLRAYGAHVVEGGLTMASGAMMEESAFQLGRSWSLGREADPKEVARSGAAAFKEALYVMPLLSANSVLRGAMERIGRMRRAQDASRVISRLLDPAEQSKLAQENPVLYERYIRRVVDWSAGSPKNAYVPREAWDVAVTAMGADPRDLHGTLVGDGGKSYDLAKQAQDVDLSIPVEKVHQLASSEALSEFARNEMRLFQGDLSVQDVAKHEADIQRGMIATLEGMSPEKRDETLKYVESVVRPPLEEVYGQTAQELQTAVSDVEAVTGGGSLHPGTLPKAEHKDTAVRLGVQWVYRSLLETYSLLPPEARGADFLDFAKSYLASTQAGGLVVGPKAIDAGAAVATEFQAKSSGRWRGLQSSRGLASPVGAGPRTQFPGVEINPQLSLFRIGDFRTFMHEWFHLDTWLQQRFIEKLQAKDVNPGAMQERFNELLTAMETSANLRRSLLERPRTLPPEEISKYHATEEKGAYSFEEYLVQAGKGTLSTAKASELAKEIGRIIADMRPDADGSAPGYAQRKLAALNHISVLQRAATLDPALVAVFDRLVGAEASSQFALDSRGAVPLKAVVDGLPEHVRARYLAAFEAAKDSARSSAVQRVLEAQRTLSARFVEEARQDLGAEQRRMLLDDPAYQALEALNGRAIDGSPAKVMFGDHADKLRLDPKTVVELVGQDAANHLQTDHPGIFSAEGQWTLRSVDAINQFANSAGFDSGLQMLAEFYRRPPLEKAITKFVDEAMRQVIGDAPDAAALGRAALEAQQSHKALLEKSIIELRFIASKLNPDLQRRAAILDGATITSLAQRSIMERKWSGLRPDGFLRGEREWGTRAWKALEEGRFDDAYGYKEAQIFNQVYYSEALRIQRDLKRIRDTVKTWSASDTIRGNMGKASIPLRDLFDHVASGMGVGLQRANSAEAESVVQRFVEDMKTQRVSDKIAFEPSALIDALGRLGTETPQVYDIHALTGIAQNLRHISDYLTEQRIGEQNTKLQADREQIRTELRLIGGKPGAGGVSVPPGAPPGAPPEGSGFGPRRVRKLQFKDAPPKLVDWKYMGDALLTSPELLVEDLGKHAFDTIFKPFLKSQERENDLRSTVFKAFDALGSNKGEWRRLANEEISTLDLDLPLDAAMVGPRAGPRDHSYLWMVALNYGNPEGRQRLQDGHGWTNEQILGALEKHLSSKEWKFVESVWKYMDEQLWPLVKHTHEERTGLTPDKVQAAPFTLSDGTVIHGGYFPLRYDPLSHRSIEYQVEQAMNGSDYQPPLATAHNFTYNRTEKFVDTLHLDWSVLPSHINAVLHDTAFRGYLSDMRALLRDPALTNDIITYHGKPKFDAIIAWLRAVALNGSEAMPPHLATAMQYLAGPRRAFIKATLGASIPVVAGDFLNPLVAATAGQITFRDLLPGLARGYDRSAYDFAANRSPYMKNRYDKPLEKWRDQFDVGTTKASHWGEVTDHIAYFFMDQADRMVSTQIWHAKYREAMRTSEGNELEAIEAADKAVRRSLPAQSLLERPAILRDKNVLGAMVMFYSWFNKTYNLAREAGRHPWAGWLGAETGMEKAGAGMKLAATVGRLMALFAVSAVLGDYVAGHGREPNQTTGEWLAYKTMMAPLTALPWASQIVDTSRAGGQPGIPILGFYTSLRNDLGAAASQNKTDDEKVQAILHATMMLAGLPANQTRRVAQFGVNASRGYIKVESPLDVMSGLGYGSKPGMQPDNPLIDLKEALK